MNKYWVFYISVLAVFAVSCSNHVPQVSNIQWDLTVYKDSEKGSIMEELAVFFLVKDEDGEDDIDELYIIHDDSFEYWKIDKDNWTKQTIDNEIWIGASRLTKEGTFPRDEYRYLVIDKTGERTEGTFFIDIDNYKKKITFPTATVDGEKIEIQSAGNTLMFSLFDSRDNGIELSEIERGSYILENLIKPENRKKARYFFLIDKESSGGYLLKSGPFMLSNVSDNEENSEQIP